ncbi:MAG: aromatic ring-hydroxylating dioxygenase subunit alpha [Chloroflexi bacterium]|nr:aromatic ring-hydroxylating dioxygenase subunit alpha [Chloroflexota bacterium]
MVDVRDDTQKGSGANGHTLQNAPVKDVRSLIPPLGLREYWYPAVEAKKVKNKPVGLKLLGDDIVFFQGKDGVAALWNVCPHRGGSLMHGDCHFEGTVSCPYHGWTFDGDGNVLAVLPEGPESKIPGKVKARKYPTVTLKGMVFIWMGDEEPAPMEEDIPPEFFDDHTDILFHTEYWPVNWNVSLENGEDAHVPYVHRDAIRTLMFPMGGSGAVGARNRIVNGRMVFPQRPAGNNRTSRGSAQKVSRYYFESLNAYWPKHSYRDLWSWMFAWARRRVTSAPAWNAPEEWLLGHHLPAMYRNDHRTDMYTRNSVPVTEGLSRQIYFKSVRPNSALGRWYERAHYRLYGRWMQVTNFSRQDFSAIAPQRYDTQEYLSSTDSHQVVWRRLILQARGMKKDDAAKLEETEAEAFSFERQEEAGKEPERISKLLEQG